MLFFLLLSLATATDDCIGLVGGRDTLLGCFTTLIDANHDNAVTPSELINFFGQQLHQPGADITTDRVFESCDVNHDGRLTMYDWNDALACALGDIHITGICRVCREAGWVVPTAKKRMLRK